MLHFQPGVAAAVAKGGADFAFLDFVVAVFGVVAAKADGGNAVHGIAVFATGIHPAAGQVHVGGDFLAVLMIVFFFRAGQAIAADTALLELVTVARQAVVVTAVAVGHTEEALIADPGGADAAVVAFRVGAGHGEAVETVHFVVIRVAAAAFHPEHQMVGGGEGDAGGSGIFIGHGVGAHAHEAFHVLAGAFGGNAAVQHVDHATTGTTAIQQGGRAAQHFDLAGQHGVHGDGVVRGDFGGIQHRGAVVEHAHPWAALAADHRPAGAAAEGVTVHTGLVIEGVAQGGGVFLGEGLLVQHGIGGAGAAAAQGQGGHVHRFQFIGGGGCSVVGLNDRWGQRCC